MLLLYHFLTLLNSTWMILRTSPSILSTITRLFQICTFLFPFLSLSLWTSISSTFHLPNFLFCSLLLHLPFTLLKVSIILVDFIEIKLSHSYTKGCQYHITQREDGNTINTILARDPLFYHIERKSCKFFWFCCGDGIAWWLLVGTTVAFNLNLFKLKFCRL